MIIGIDVSQIVYEKTGVSRYVIEMVKSLIKEDSVNHYILFGVSWGRRRILVNFFDQMKLINPGIKCVFLPVPISLFDLVWNRLHIFPIECFIGNVDVFWSSDWVQPPLRKALGVTTVHDLSFFCFPNETDKTIIQTQGRRLRWVIKECRKIFCDSEATKQDVMKYLGIDFHKLDVVYPGYYL